MAQDVMIKADEHGLYDLQISNGDFASAAGFGSLIPTSYFTDARASVAMVQDAMKRRGWVGDEELGSQLWLLDQARLNQETINLAEVYAREALQFLIDDKIAQGIEVTATQTDNRSLSIFTTITTIDDQTQRYVSLWKGTSLS